LPSVSLLLPAFNSIEEELILFRNLMASNRGIICPSDCFCYDPIILDVFREGKEIYIYPTIAELANQKKIEEALAAGDNMLDIHQRFNVSWESIGNTYYNLFGVAICSSRTLPRAIAKQYIQSALEIYRKIYPYSERLTSHQEVREAAGTSQLTPAF